MADQGSDPRGQLPGQLVDSPVTGFDKPLPEQKVFGGITADDQFGEDHEAGPPASRGFDGRPHVFEVPAKVSHEGIPLSEGNQHRVSSSSGADRNLLQLKALATKHSSLGDRVPPGLYGRETGSLK
jgi:hypothetical protein